MGNTSSDTTEFAHQFDQAVRVKEQMKNEFHNVTMNYFLTNIRSTIPQIILSKTEKGIHEHVYHCKVSDEVKKLYSQYMKKSELTETDTANMVFGVYEAVHSDEFREQIKLFNNELGKNVKIIVPRRFKERGNILTGAGGNDEIRDHNFSMQMDETKWIKGARYQYTSKYYNRYLNHLLFEF